MDFMLIERLGEVQPRNERRHIRERADNEALPDVLAHPPNTVVVRGRTSPLSAGSGSRTTSLGHGSPIVPSLARSAQMSGTVDTP